MIRNEAPPSNASSSGTHESHRHTSRPRGFIYTLAIAFNRVVPSWLFRFSVMNVYQLDKKKMSAVVKRKDLHVDLIEDQAAREELRRQTLNSVPVEATKTDFAFRARSESSESFLGGLWAAVDQMPEVDLGFVTDLSEQQCWIYCAYVDKESRGAAVYQQLLASAATKLNQSGHAEILVSVAPWNRASRHVHEKFSVQRLGRIIAIRILRGAAVCVSGQLLTDRTITTNIAAPIRISKNT